MSILFSHSNLVLKYSAINAFKHAICNATGGSYHYHLPESLTDSGNHYVADKWYWGRINDQKCTSKKNKGLSLFLNGSCFWETIIPHKELENLLKDLEAIAPIVRIQDTLLRCIYIEDKLVVLDEKWYPTLKKLISVIKYHIKHKHDLTWG